MKVRSMSADPDYYDVKRLEGMGKIPCTVHDADGKERQSYNCQIFGEMLDGLDSSPIKPLQKCLDATQAIPE